MTPDARVAVTGARATGVWRSRTVAGSVALFVERDEIVVRVDDTGDELAAPLAALSGAAWRADVLTLHRGDEALALTGGAQLDRAWVAIMHRACTVPEVTRGLRALGSARGGDVEWQAKFFGPLLQARRRLESEEPLDWRVAAFDAAALEERVRATIADMSGSRYPKHPPFRRALEAELLEAAEPLFARLARVADAAAQLHQAEERSRIESWRLWAAQIRDCFVAADRSWGAIVAVSARA